MSKPNNKKIEKTEKSLAIFYSGFLWLIFIPLLLMLIFVLVVAHKFQYISPESAIVVFFVSLGILLLLHKFVMKKLLPFITEKSTKGLNQ